MVAVWLNFDENDSTHFSQVEWSDILCREVNFQLLSCESNELHHNQAKPEDHFIESTAKQAEDKTP